MTTRLSDRGGFLLAKPDPISQSPIHYAASKLVSNAAFFAKGARLAVKSVADRVGGAGAKPPPPHPHTTGEPAGFMQSHNKDAATKFEDMADREREARAATGHDAPLTSSYPEAGAAARATAGVKEEEGEKKKE